MKLSIIVPIYNERLWVLPFWRKLKTAPMDRCEGVNSVEILVVDDGSTDGTAPLLSEVTQQEFRFECGMPATVELLRHPKNLGKGRAVRAGIKASSGDVILIQDADMEYSPSDYPGLLTPILNQSADAVVGSRFTGPCRRVLYFWHSVVNGILTFIFNALNDVNLTDIESGYKVVRGHVARSLRLTSDRFGIEPELLSRLIHAKLRLYEVPISYAGRSYEQGKKIRARDGIAALFHILRYGIFDTEPYEPGLMQTLTALNESSQILYLPLIDRAFKGIPSGNLRILEIGAGIGALSYGLLQRGSLVSTDLSEEFVEVLKTRFGHFDGFEARTWDATHPPWDGAGKFDVIVAINILEHIDNDVAVLESWKNLLTPEGRLLVLVPNYPRLYSPIDKAIGHFRRYKKSELEGKMHSIGLKPENTFFGNALGILGWSVNGVLLQRSELPGGQLRLYTTLKSLFSFFESWLEKYIGLSIIVVATPEQPA